MTIRTSHGRAIAAEQNAAAKINARAVPGSILTASDGLPVLMLLIAAIRSAGSY
jgi:hypothetical protein